MSLYPGTILDSRDIQEIVAAYLATAANASPARCLSPGFLFDRTEPQSGGYWFTSRRCSCKTPNCVLRFRFAVSDARLSVYIDEANVVAFQCQGCVSHILTSPDDFGTPHFLRDCRRYLATVQSEDTKQLRRAHTVGRRRRTSSVPAAPAPAHLTDDDTTSQPAVPAVTSTHTPAAESTTGSLKHGRIVGSLFSSDYPALLGGVDECSQARLVRNTKMERKCFAQDLAVLDRIRQVYLEYIISCRFVTDDMCFLP